MSIENVIIYFLLPVLGWILIRIDKLSRKITALSTKLDDHLDGKHVRAKGSDTDRMFR